MPDQEESKKDTVRINLPTGVAGRPGTPVPPGPPTQKLKPEQDAKKETAVMGAPAPAAKKDTSRVQVAAAKPSTPDMPRPTVRLRREEGSTQATSAPTAPAAAPMAPVAVVAAEGPGGAAVGLSVGAMLFSVAVVVYLAMVAMS
jgi:hypothetical protein